MKKKKRNFSSFTLAEAYKELHLTNLVEWKLEAPPVAPSEFFHERLERLKEKFAFTTSERGKELLIDAICDEALASGSALRIWKAAAIESDDLIGQVDYVVAPKRGYLDTPLLCIVEAKKDDFEQGLAQCLVEMKACRESNAQAGAAIDVYGVVTNGEGWVFYQFTTDGQVLETALFALRDIAEILGCLRLIFKKCEANIAMFAQAA
jgi:hypothetical protein